MECDDAETVFRRACQLGLEGIVSKRRDSPYRSGRSRDWLKMKNPDVAECKADIARQREIIQDAVGRRPSADLAEERMLRALEESLRAFERHRQVILERIKKLDGTGRNRIMIFGPKDDGTHVVEFRTAEAEALAISIPRSDAHVIRQFEMPRAIRAGSAERKGKARRASRVASANLGA